MNGSEAALTAWQARWTNTLTLHPGVNRIVVQSLDSNNVEFARSTLDVWYNNGAPANTVSGTSGWKPRLDDGWKSLFRKRQLDSAKWRHAYRATGHDNLCGVGRNDTVNGTEGSLLKEAMVNTSGLPGILPRPGIGEAWDFSIQR